MHVDNYGYPLSTHSAGATTAYLRGIRRMLETQLGARHDFMEAIRLDSELAVAYVAMAGVATSPSEAAALRGRAVDLTPHTTLREKRHVEVIAGLATRNAGIVDTAIAHLAEFPRDALVLEHTLRYLFFFGGPGREASALKLVASCAGNYPADDWYIPARHAFFLQELRRYSDAEPHARTAIERNPDNGNAVHALAHVLHGLGAHGNAHDLLTRALTKYHGFFRSHFFWHAGIVELAWGQHDVLDMFDARLAPPHSTGPAHLALADAVGYLISCGLAGIATAERWTTLRPLVEQLAESPGQPFVDAHVAIALAVLDDREALEALGRRLTASDAPSARWSLPIVEAIASRQPERLFALDDMAREGMGGSRIEREILDELAVVFEPRTDLRVRFGGRRPIHPVLARFAGSPR